MFENGSILFLSAEDMSLHCWGTLTSFKVFVEVDQISLKNGNFLAVTKPVTFPDKTPRNIRGKNSGSSSMTAATTDNEMSMTASSVGLSTADSASNPTPDVTMEDMKIDDETPYSKAISEIADKQRRVDGPSDVASLVKARNFTDKCE